MNRYVTARFKNVKFSWSYFCRMNKRWRRDEHWTYRSFNQTPLTIRWRWLIFSIMRRHSAHQDQHAGSGILCQITVSVIYLVKDYSTWNVMIMRCWMVWLLAGKEIADVILLWPWFRALKTKLPHRPVKPSVPATQTITLVHVRIHGFCDKNGDPSLCLCYRLPYVGTKIDFQASTRG